MSRFVLLAALVWVPGSATAQQSATREPRSEVAVSADQLWREFAEGRQATLDRYHGKRIRFVGRRRGGVFDDRPILYLSDPRSGEGSLDAHVRQSEWPTADKRPAAAEVIVVCLFDGDTSDDTPLLSDCLVEDPAPAVAVSLAQFAQEFADDWPAAVKKYYLNRVAVTGYLAAATPASGDGPYRRRPELLLSTRPYAATRGEYGLVIAPRGLALITAYVRESEWPKVARLQPRVSVTVVCLGASGPLPAGVSGRSTVPVLNDCWVDVPPQPSR